MATPNIHAAEAVCRQVQKLLNDNDVTGQGAGFVYLNRFTPLKQENFNALNVIQGPEEVVNRNVNITDSNLLVWVDIYSTGDSSYKQPGPTVDQAISFCGSLRVEATKIILADPRLGLGETKVNWVEPVGAELPTVNEDSEFPYCVQRTNWLVQYRTPRDDPQFP